MTIVPERRRSQRCRAVEQSWNATATRKVVIIILTIIITYYSLLTNKDDELYSPSAFTCRTWPAYFGIWRRDLEAGFEDIRPSVRLIIFLHAGREAEGCDILRLWCRMTFRMKFYFTNLVDHSAPTVSTDSRTIRRWLNKTRNRNRVIQCQYCYML